MTPCVAAGFARDAGGYSMPIEPVRGQEAEYPKTPKRSFYMRLIKFARCSRCVAPLCLVFSLSAMPSQAQVLWADAAHSRARFISEGVLNGLEPSAFDAQALATLRATIETYAASYRGRHFCAVQPNLDPNPGADVGWRSLAQKLQARYLVVRGKVEELVPGWNPAWKLTETLVRINVLEVFGQDSRLSAGSRISYIQSFGEMHLEGKTYCTMANARDYKAAVGDELIVSARSIDPFNDELLEVDPQSDLYAVHDDTVEVLGMKPPPSACPQVSLKELRHPQEGVH